MNQNRDGFSSMATISTKWNSIPCVVKSAWFPKKPYYLTVRYRKISPWLTPMRLWRKLSRQRKRQRPTNLLWPCPMAIIPASVNGGHPYRGDNDNGLRSLVPSCKDRKFSFLMRPPVPSTITANGKCVWISKKLSRIIRSSLLPIV